MTIAAPFKLNYANVMDRAITCQPHIFTLITWGWCTLVTRGKLACPIKINPIRTSGRQGWQTCLPGASEASRDFSKFQNLELLNQIFLCNGNVLFLFPNHSPKKILVVSNCFASPILNHLFRIYCLCLCFTCTVYDHSLTTREKLNAKVWDI